MGVPLPWKTSADLHMKRIIQSWFPNQKSVINLSTRSTFIWLYNVLAMSMEIFNDMFLPATRNLDSSQILWILNSRKIVFIRPLFHGFNFKVILFLYWITDIEYRVHITIQPTAREKICFMFYSREMVSNKCKWRGLNLI